MIGCGDDGEIAIDCFSLFLLCSPWKKVRIMKIFFSVTVKFMFDLTVFSCRKIKKSAKFLRSLVKSSWGGGIFIISFSTEPVFSVEKVRNVESPFYTTLKFTFDVIFFE